MLPETEGGLLPSPGSISFLGETGLSWMEDEWFAGRSSRIEINRYEVNQTSVVIAENDPNN